MLKPALNYMRKIKSPGQDSKLTSGAQKMGRSQSAPDAPGHQSHTLWALAISSQLS